jgi:hypothetical protein
VGTFLPRQLDIKVGGSHSHSPCCSIGAAWEFIPILPKAHFVSSTDPIGFRAELPYVDVPLTSKGINMQGVRVPDRLLLIQAQAGLELLS